MPFDPDKFLAEKPKNDFDPDKFLSEDKPGIGSQALDYGSRALDYAGGLGRVSAAGLTDLARLAGSGFDFDNAGSVVRPGDFTKAIQGQAPTTEDYLEREGMEDGALRTGIGFVGDVGLDPTTYMSGGLSALSKLGKAGKLGKAAAVATAPSHVAGELLGKAISGTAGKAYKTATRKIAPKLASAVSGASEQGLKKYIKNPEEVQKVAENIFEHTDEAINQAKTNILTKKTEVAEQMNTHMRESGKMIDISGIKISLDDKIEKLLNLERRSPQQEELLEQMLDLKQNSFSDIVGGVGEDIPDLIDANRMFDLKESLRRSKGSSTIFDAKTGQTKQVDARFKSLSKDLYGKVNQAVDNTFEGAKDLRDSFSKIGEDYDFVNKRFKQDHIRPEADTNALLRMSSNKQTRKKLQEIDSIYGSNIANSGDDARAAFQLADPSLIPVSGQGVVSTGRIAASSAVGAQVLGDLLGTRGGAAAGLIGGTMAAGPAAMSRAGRGAYNLERGISKIPAKQSMFQRMLIKQNREE